MIRFPLASAASTAAGSREDAGGGEGEGEGEAEVPFPLESGERFRFLPFVEAVCGAASEEEGDAATALERFVSTPFLGRGAPVGAAVPAAAAAAAVDKEEDGNEEEEEEEERVSATEAVLLLSLSVALAAEAETEEASGREGAAPRKPADPTGLEEAEPEETAEFPGAGGAPLDGSDSRAAAAVAVATEEGVCSGTKGEESAAGSAVASDVRESKASGPEGR